MATSSFLDAQVIILVFGRSIVVDMKVDLSNSPLTYKYFKDYLVQLIACHEHDQSGGRFVGVVNDSTMLEEMLQRIETVGCTKDILSEIGNISDCHELASRIMNAWAELRCIDQLLRENYSTISKTTAIADLLATKDKRNYAFQVTRINAMMNERMRYAVDLSPFGPLEDIHKRLGTPLSTLFWSAIENKNAKFRKWPNGNDLRCIVVVTSDSNLQDSMTRHIACSAIASGIKDLTACNFDRLLWLPDLGNGALFYIDQAEAGVREIECWADWCDELSASNRDCCGVSRRKVDIGSYIPRYL